MLRFARHYAIWCVGALALFLVVVGTQSITVPVSADEHELCLQTAEQNKESERSCKLQEPMWNRTKSDPVAYYTLWLTIFTGALALVGVAQWDAIGRQLALAREEFIASYRPRLVARNLFARSANADERRRGTDFNLSFRLFNVGVGLATVTKIELHTTFFTPPLMAIGSIQDLAIAEPRQAPFTVKLGHPIDIECLGTTGSQYEWNSATTRLEFAGSIFYSDEIGRQFEVAFRRWYDRAAYRFRVVEDAEDEYSY